MVYGVTTQGDYVWVATAAGASRLNTRTGQWSIFNERNTPMQEIWTYGVSAGEDKVYYAVWGGGVLEYDVKTERWKDYNDPDGENEMILFKDQGLIHEITTSVSYVNKILWIATYFGASRYDGRNWRNFLDKDSGLPSNFLNQVKSMDGTRTWFSTDKGLGVFRRRKLGDVPARAGHARARNAGAERGGQGGTCPRFTAPGPQLRVRRSIFKEKTSGWRPPKA